MKAVRFHKTGGPEVLVYEDVPDPTPKDGKVLIKVEAVGLNFTDVMRRRGDKYPDPSPPPFILGGEVAGVIAAVGNGVTGLEIGTRVLATPGAGGYAQYICVPAAMIIPLPPGISAVQATAVVANGLTAALVLRRAARLAPGESVLIEAAAGGVGYFAVQLAKLYGAGKVIAAASTPEKRALAESLGADASVDYTAPGWAEKVKDLTDGRGVDILLESGGDTVHEAIRAIAPFGRMIYIGRSSGKIALIDPWELTVANHTVTSFNLGTYLAAFPELIQPTLGEVLGFITTGKLSLQIGAVLPLSQAIEAHRLLEGRKTTGKVVLQPWVDA